MKLLLLHSSYLEFEPQEKAVDNAEEYENGKERIEECLVVFNALEKDDADNLESVTDQAVEEIEDVIDQVDTDKVVIYPWVHLTSNPGNPDDALEAQLMLEEKLQDDFQITRAPFGWYKQFEIHVKGHPLAELSREIRPGEKEKPAKERKEEEEFFRFILIDEEGNEHKITRKDWRDHELLNKDSREFRNLRKFVNYEIGEGEAEEESPHIKLMKKHELVDYCGVSDAGHFKWHPKGVLIKELILDYQDRLARDYEAFKIQNPLVYRFDDERIQKLIGEFQEKMYQWNENGKRLVLRPASDPGQFPYAQNLTFSYKHLPIKQYEEAPCFRKEQKGELSGLRRVRSFLMTDMHTFTKDEEMAKEEFEKLSFICKDLMDSVISKGDWVMGWEGTESYWEDNKEWMKKLNKDIGVPGFVKLMKKRSHYYSMKNEFQAIHPNGNATQVSTVQMDLINGKRFNITYVGEDNKKHPCTILHCSTFGSIERTLTFMLEDAIRNEDENPLLPVWLSPTQVRVIPVSDDNLEYAESVMEEIEAGDIRADIDDRDESVSKKIRKAELEWVPYIAVVGEREEESETVNVRFRKDDGKQEEMIAEELKEIVKQDCDGMPYRPLPLPKKLSQRPKFVG